MRLGWRKRPTETNRRELNGVRSHDPPSEIPARCRASRSVLMNVEKKMKISGAIAKKRVIAAEQDAGLANSSLPPSKGLARVGEERRVGRKPAHGALETLSYLAISRSLFFPQYRESTPPRYTRSDDWIRWRTTHFRGNPRKTPRGSSEFAIVLSTSALLAIFALCQLPRRKLSWIKAVGNVTAGF